MINDDDLKKYDNTKIFSVLYFKKNFYNQDIPFKENPFS
jgi:hypothetical protein